MDVGLRWILSNYEEAGLQLNQRVRNRWWEDFFPTNLIKVGLESPLAGGFLFDKPSSKQVWNVHWQVPIILQGSQGLVSLLVQHFLSRTSSVLPL